MGIRVEQGRVFDARDDESAPPVAVVSQTFVRMYLSGGQPLGQRVVVRKRIEIVGVVGDVKFGGPEAASVPILYLPMNQSPRAGGALALLTSGDPAALAKAVRAALAQIDRDTPVTGIKTMERIAAESMLQPRLQAGVMAVFAGLALVLSALGIYGMMSYTVARGTREIGLRIALGATAGDVLRLVLGAALRMAGAGLLTGLAAAFALTRLLSSLLFQVKPADPPTFVAVSLLLVLVALAAGYIPARRAMRIDPMAALRDE
jgi:putative ABC transport system permease protein